MGSHAQVSALDPRGAVSPIESSFSSCHCFRSRDGAQISHEEVEFNLEQLTACTEALVRYKREFPLGDADTCSGRHGAPKESKGPYQVPREPDFLFRCLRQSLRMWSIQHPRSDRSWEFKWSSKTDGAPVIAICYPWESNVRTVVPPCFKISSSSILRTALPRLSKQLCTRG